MLTRLPLFLAIAVLALFTGCGGDEENAPSEPASTGGSGGDFVEVRMKNIKFVPETVTAKVGQTIRWVNNDSVAHDVTAKSGADFASDSIGKGEAFEAKVEKPGKIAYECTIHAGQKGTIDVQG
jgi:plastocyanin